MNENGKDQPNPDETGDRSETMTSLSANIMSRIIAESNRQKKVRDQMELAIDDIIGLKGDTDPEAIKE